MKDWENQFAKQDTFFQSFVQEGDTWNRERTKQVIDGTMSLYNQLNDILLKNEAQKNDQLIKGIDDKYAKDKEKLDEDLKNKKLSQEQYNKEAVELEKKKEQQISKIKREQWEKEKKAAIAKATINTLVGTTQALAEGGIAGIITGALVLAAGIAEVASIASQKNPYRKGTAQILSGNSHEGGGISLGQFGTAEGGEMLGILSKNKTKKFGKPMMDLFDGINKGNDSKMLKGLSGLVVSAMPEIKQAFTGQAVSATKDLSKSMDGVKMSAKQLDAEIRAVNESIKKTNDPKAIAALKEYRQELIAEEAQLGKTTQKFESMRGKIMAIKNELFKLRAEGKQGTQRFQELTVELARLGNIKDDIIELGKALSSDTRHIDGMIQGVQGLVGYIYTFNMSFIFILNNSPTISALSSISLGLGIIIGSLSRWLFLLIRF